jgi:hypothetical protein
MPPKKAKPKPLTQKAEKEMMGQEDIASTAKELDDAKARAVARMAKAREAKKAKAVASSKENITMKVEEAPYGYTKSGKKRTKPLKEKAPKVKAPIKKELTLQDRILALPDEVRKYASEFVPTPVSIKNARRYIQLLEKGVNILRQLVAERGQFWTQDGYYTTVGDKNVDEIIDDLENTYSDFVDVLKEAKVWFKKTYGNQKIDSSQELRKSDEKIFEPEFFGLEENRNRLEYDDENYDDDDEFNGEYLLGDYRDLENGIEDAMSVLKQIIDVLKKGGFNSPVEIDEEDETEGEGLFGGALSAKELKGLLGASYDPKIDKVGDFVLDSKLSTKTSKVYHNPNSGQTVVAHKGTEGILDWGNNAVYALGGKTAYKMTSRYKEAEKVQKQAEKKYGAKNVSTIGHSQGGLQAELLGGKSKEIITLNKATRPFESNTNKNQTDVRSGRDVVSALNPFEKKSSKNIEIEGESYNPLAEHSGDVLDRLDENQMIGEGIRRIMEGGATPQQRNIAGILRSRISKKVSPFLDASLPNNAWIGLIKLLHSLVHSVDTPEEIRASINTDAYDIKDFLPAYTDYEDRENYIDGRVATFMKYGLSNKTLPDKVLQMAIDSYLSSLMLDPTTRNRNFNVVGDRLEPKPSDEIPKSLIDSKYITNDKLRRYKRLVETIGNLNIVDTAYWTDKAEKTGRLAPITTKLNQLQQSWTQNKEATFNKLRGEIVALIQAVNTDINDWVRKASRIEDVELRDKLLKNMKEGSVFEMNDGNDDDYEIDWDLPSWNDNPANIRVFRDAKTSVFPQRPAPAPAVAVAPAVAPVVVAKGKAPAQAQAKAPAKGKVGKGLPTNKIDFEDINWGSLTEQMKAYNSSHSKDFDLEGFARMIIADPSKFQKRTLKRARFYINVLLPKKK